MQGGDLLCATVTLGQAAGDRIPHVYRGLAVDPYLADFFRPGQNGGGKLGCHSADSSTIGLRTGGRGQSLAVRAVAVGVVAAVSALGRARASAAAEAIVYASIGPGCR
jgi:hypothetical protein